MLCYEDLRGKFFTKNFLLYCFKLMQFSNENDHDNFITILNKFFVKIN